MNKVDLPNPWIKPGSPALQLDSLLSEPLGLLRSHFLFLNEVLTLYHTKMSVYNEFPWKLD